MNFIFAIAIYIGSGITVSQALVDPTADHIVAAALSLIAVYYTFGQLSTERALKAAHQQLADQNALLKAMREAVTKDSVDPIREYWRARKR